MKMATEPAGTIRAIGNRSILADGSAQPSRPTTGRGEVTLIGSGLLVDMAHRAETSANDPGCMKTPQIEKRREGSFLEQAISCLARNRCGPETGFERSPFYHRRASDIARAGGSTKKSVLA